jgi:hypothetical protein
MKEGENNLVAAYQRCFNSEDGETVLNHLRDVCRMNQFGIDPKVSNDELRSYHLLSRIVNYIEYMRSVENFDRPHADGPFEIINNEI